MKIILSLVISCIYYTRAEDLLVHFESIPESRNHGIQIVREGDSSSFQVIVPKSFQKEDNIMFSGNVLDDNGRPYTYRGANLLDCNQTMITVETIKKILVRTLKLQYDCPYIQESESEVSLSKSFTIMGSIQETFLEDENPKPMPQKMTMTGRLAREPNNLEMLVAQYTIEVQPDR